MPFYKRIEMTGQIIGHLTVVGPAPKRKRLALWRCLCVCGRERIVAGVVLRSGSVRSCGRNHDGLQRSLPKPPDHELAWATGLFEGEGSVRISKPAHRNWGSLNVDVPNTDEQIVRFFSIRWGGSVHSTEAKGHRKKFWRWRLASLQAAVFLSDIRPFIRTRRVQERIDHGMTFQAQKESSRSDEEYRQQQWESYWWMAELNARGVQPSAAAHP